MRMLLRAAASLGLLALVFYFSGPTRLLAAIANADLLCLIAALAASIGASILNALRWHALAGPLQDTMTTGQIKNSQHLETNA